MRALRWLAAAALLYSAASPAEHAAQLPSPTRPSEQLAPPILDNAVSDGWHLNSLPDGATLALAPVRDEAHPAPSTGIFLEGRIGALQPVSGKGQLILFGRHQADNWTGAGLALADGLLEVNVVRMQDGVLTRIKQLRRLQALGRRADLLRLELAAGAMTIYLNGEKLGTIQDQPVAGASTAPGYYSQGKVFRIDQLRSGPAASKPARIALAGVASVLRTEEGARPFSVPVSALGGDGLTRVAFTAHADNPRVAKVVASASGVRVVPIAVGETGVLVSSRAEPAVQTWFKVVVGARFLMPPQRLPAAALFPPAGARAVPPDTPLRLAFSAPPTPGGAGSVRIFRKRDMTLVDTIRPGEEVVGLGPGAELHRYVRREPIRIVDNSAIIAPHPGVLAADTEYLVAVNAGLFDATGGSWSFRTRKETGARTPIVVDDDGPADFRTVQGALDHAMARYSKDAPLTIEIGNGDYEELLFLRDRNQVTLRGESRDGVIIHARNNEGIHAGSGASNAPGAPGVGGGRSLFLAEDLDLLTIESLTLRNDSQRRYSTSGQAETLYFNSDHGRLVARDASFFSEQDTVQLKGYAWFFRTLVAGNVDFIWGANRAALFEQSEIRSVGDSANPGSGGYVVQARTVSAGDPGFVFLDSVLTHAAGPAGNPVPAASTFLARSPGSATSWDNVTFINCRMGDHIAPRGWAGAGVNQQPAANPAQPDAKHGWREHGSTGLAGETLDLSKRSGGYLLDATELRANVGMRRQIFAGFNGGQGWEPR